MKKKYLSLRGISEILSEKEMRNVVGASSTGSGGGFCAEPYVPYECNCTSDGYSLTICVRKDLATKANAVSGAENACYALGKGDAATCD